MKTEIQSKMTGENAEVYISVLAKAEARKETVERMGNSFTIAVKEPAERNEANKRIRQIVASELDLPPSRVRLCKGHRSQHKTFLITK